MNPPLPAKDHRRIRGRQIADRIIFRRDWGQHGAIAFGDAESPPGSCVIEWDHELQSYGSVDEFIDDCRYVGAMAIGAELAHDEHMLLHRLKVLCGMKLQQAATAEDESWRQWHRAQIKVYEEIIALLEAGEHYPKQPEAQQEGA